MNTVAIIQARMGSTRVPGKVMRPLLGRPVLRWTYDAVKKAYGIDKVILATSTLPADDVVEEYCKKHRIECFRGSESDVLDRFYQCAKKYEADIVLRLTADCPFIDPQVVSEVVRLREMTNADYASNCYPATYPDGLDTECFTFAALEASWKEATSQIDRDCLTQFMVRNRSRFRVVNLTCPLPGMVDERWVLDTEKDWNLCNAIHEVAILNNNSYIEISRYLDEHPEIRNLNNGGIRNERFYESLSEERLPPRTFAGSKRILQRAIQTIPLGSQTYSKSHLQYPEGDAPLYVSHGDGGYVFDVDGNRYVDLVGALCPVILGYCDTDVDAAIRAQLDNGVSFSLSTELECELSELLCQHIPCAEMVKFGKSGTDVTTAAVRLARSYRGRKHVLVGGYHGWSDWSMANTEKNMGIPYEIKGLSHYFDYGKGDCSVKPDDVAAIIVEPNDHPDKLGKLRDFCDEHGIVLIFDEIITGFRYGIGGAQSLYNVTPDLACFGKAMANGMPISALVGRKDIMRLLSNPRIHYSGTFFGETLSLAAALATIKKLIREDVPTHLAKSGAKLEAGINDLLKTYNLENMIVLSGWHSNQKLSFFTEQIKTLFMSTMIQNGVLIINSNVLSFAHKEPELKRIITAYENTFKVISNSCQDGSILNVSPVVNVPLRAKA